MSVMYVATLDILTEKGGFDPQAARAIGEAIDLEIARSRDSSATREDVAECRHALGEGIGELRSEMSSLRAELKGNVSALRAELKEDMSTLRADSDRNLSALRVDMQTMKADVVRWIFAAIMGQTAMLLGVLYFFMKYFK